VSRAACCTAADARQQRLPPRAAPTFLRALARAREARHASRDGHAERAKMRLRAKRRRFTCLRLLIFTRAERGRMRDIFTRAAAKERVMRQEAERYACVLTSA